MLHLMLGSSSEAVAVGEVLNWFRPIKAHHFQPSCACGRTDCPFWNQLSETKESRFHKAVTTTTGKPFVVDSSKEISWLIDTRRWASTSGMSVFNVFIWKDPVDLAHSFWKRTGDLMLWRSEFLKYYKRIDQVALPLLTVNLGELLSTPNTTLSQLCAAIGMRYEPGMERFWEFEHHHLFGNYGVRRQAQIGESYFQPPSYPPEFESQRAILEDGLKEDNEVKELIEFLRDRDVAASGENVSKSQWSVELSHPLPLWYYGQKLKRRVRRLRPKPVDLGRSHSVATIPVENQKD